jgi:uncharacterized protein with NRDE domain
MCIILFAFDYVPEYPLILLANRDEFYERPTADAAFWKDYPDIYGGRDLKSGGTWLGVTKSGRFAAVTNYRDPSAPVGARSRGALVADFLKSEISAEEYMKQIICDASEYSGFNLIAGEIGKRRELFYYSNRGGKMKKFSVGSYGLSNHLLDTPWPKVEKGKKWFAEALANGASNAELFEILSDESLADDADLPSTGVPFEVEKALSAIFIKMPGYGTRCSTVLRFNENQEWDLEERVFV